jgi:hypothetical protein
VSETKTEPKPFSTELTKGQFAALTLGRYAINAIALYGRTQKAVVTDGRKLLVVNLDGHKEPEAPAKPTLLQFDELKVKKKAQVNVNGAIEVIEGASVTKPDPLDVEFPDWRGVLPESKTPEEESPTVAVIHFSADLLGDLCAAARYLAGKEGVATMRVQVPLSYERTGPERAITSCIRVDLLVDGATKGEAAIMPMSP